MSAFDWWNKSVLEKDIDSMHEEDWFLPLSPEERPVSWGQRPNNEGLWNGMLSYPPRHEIMKLQIGDEWVFGVLVGRVYGFTWEEGAAVFLGIDGRVYFAPAYNQDEWNEGGWGV
jgi:hypothetical protein